MEKTMIIVRGHPSSGKSAAISYAYKQLRSEGTLLLFPGVDSRPRRRNNGPPEVRGHILRINDVLVGFASPGDTPEHLDRCLEPLIKAKCLVVIGATRVATNHPTWRRAMELALDHDFRDVRLDKPALRKDAHTADWQVACDQANQDWAAKIIVPALREAIAKAQPPGRVDAK